MFPYIRDVAQCLTVQLGRCVWELCVVQETNIGLTCIRRVKLIVGVIYSDVPWGSLLDNFQQTAWLLQCACFQNSSFRNVQPEKNRMANSYKLNYEQTQHVGYKCYLSSFCKTSKYKEHKVRILIEPEGLSHVTSRWHGSVILSRIHD
jgi:hypothetical protein